IRAAVRQYMAEVESGVYPGEEHSFHSVLAPQW
ncbi:hypothetical protein ACUOFC_23700, partial [Escherichia sp. TWPC-MK]